MSVSVVGFAGLVWATGMPSDRDREHMVWHKIEKRAKFALVSPTRSVAFNLGSKNDTLTVNEMHKPIRERRRSSGFLGIDESLFSSPSLYQPPRSAQADARWLCSFAAAMVSDRTIEGTSSQWTGRR
jgi:hypothetical protein